MISSKLSALLLVCCGLISIIYLTPSGASVSSVASVSASADVDRAADRQAIRAHIESIFKAYIARDCETIRATHARDWIGFTNNSRSIVRGLDAYMNGTSARFFCVEKTAFDPNVQGLADYKISEIDFMFYGDVALVPYVAETINGKTARLPGKLRSLDVYAKVNGTWTQVGSNIYLHPDTVQALRSQPGQLAPADKNALMAAREAVWRAYFSNDQAQLEKLIPEEALAVDGTGQEPINNRANIFEGARKVAGSGSKLVRLEFPRTEMQVYGDTAILYTTYLLELENAQGQRNTQKGRGTEIFVRRNGAWLNTGWHLQPDK